MKNKERIAVICRHHLQMQGSYNRRLINMSGLLFLVFKSALQHRPVNWLLLPFTTHPLWSVLLMLRNSVIPYCHSPVKTEISVQSLSALFSTFSTLVLWFNRVLCRWLNSSLFFCQYYIRKHAPMALICIICCIDNRIIFLMKRANICYIYGVLTCDNNDFLVTVVSTFLM